ncbi:FkbM family methyltransferase [Luminiphilus sp.]|nr:FkbM family methyltransferase [Luminiphilus sp.]
MLDVVRWFSDDGDNTLLLDYPLTPESVVFDVGAYHGEYSERVFKKWGVKEIYAFEPHPNSLKTLQKRTADIPLKIFPFGLSDTTTTFSLSDDANASSFMSGGEEDTISCEVRNVSNFITETGINQIDLLKLNIEGGEYAVLFSLIESNLISCIENIVVQYHTCVPDYEEKRA